MGLGRAKWRAQSPKRAWAARDREPIRSGTARGVETRTWAAILFGCFGGTVERAEGSGAGDSTAERGGGAELAVDSVEARLFTGATWHWRAFGFGVASLTQEQTAESALESRTLEMLDSS